MAGPHGADWHAQAFGLFGLAEAGLGADRLDVWPGSDAAPGRIALIAPTGPKTPKS